MFEEAKRNLQPLSRVFELITGPFRNPETQNKGLPNKIVQSILNCSNAFLEEVSAANGAYLFPLLGIARFFSMPSLRSILLGSMLMGFAVAVFVTALLFIFAWVPQFAVSFIITPFLAFPAATLLVLAESWYVSNSIAKLTWMDELQDRIFDEVVKDESKLKDAAGGVSKDLQG